MPEKSTLVRTTLSRDEYKQIRIIAIERGVPIQALCGDALRKQLLKGKGA